MPIWGRMWRGAALLLRRELAKTRGPSESINRDGLSEKATLLQANLVIIVQQVLA